MYHKNSITILLLALAACLSCGPVEQDEVFNASLRNPELNIDADAEYGVERIADFSRVGYKYGDMAIPEYGVVATISKALIDKAVEAGLATDDADYIQKTIDRVGKASGGTILLKKGTYNLSRIIFVDFDNVVLKGEDRNETILLGTGTEMRPVISLGKNIMRADGENETETVIFIAGRKVRISSLTAQDAGGEYGATVIHRLRPVNPNRSYRAGSRIVEAKVPFGSLSLEVENPGLFSVGQRVCIFRPATPEWISDIGMDKIASNGREDYGTAVNQWTPEKYSLYWERVVVAKKGHRIFLDSPVVLEIDSKYGAGLLCPCYTERISGSGVENLTIDNTYDSTIMSGTTYVDDAHCWTGVSIQGAEDCWVREVTSRHLAFSCVDMGALARKITVENCASFSPVSVVSGGRRYAFIIEGGELCLVKNCEATDDRHNFVTSGRCQGPNVYTDCRAFRSYSDVGPHNNFATGTLFDCITADGERYAAANPTGGAMEARDRGNSGSGHGIAGMNTVFWNCEAVWMEIQNMRTGGRNYSVGFIGRKTRNVNYTLDYFGKPVEDYYVTLLGPENSRPDGEWYPEIEFEAAGTEHISLPCESDRSWWPYLTKESYSNPLSLYQCQLEDRHARGIWLGNL